MIPRRKIECFLLALANRDRNVSSVLPFLGRFGDMLADLPSARQWNRIFSTQRIRAYSDETTLELLREDVEEQEKPVDENLELKRIGDLSSLVRGIWLAETRQERQCRILALHRVLSNSWDPTFLLTKEVVLGDGLLRRPFQQAILHLLKQADRALICPNPECPARFFFRVKRRQRYCSEVCAGFGQRIAKQKWWAAEGNRWRRERKRQSTAARKKRGKQYGTRKAR
jgi:hypothetical protein